MQSSRKPNAQEQKFHDWLREQGCAVCGRPAEIHHCVGSTAKHNKVELGHWWVIPLCEEHHRHQQNGIHAKGDWRKPIEKMFWYHLCFEYATRHVAELSEQGVKVLDPMQLVDPVPKEVFVAILNYHR